jgi:hypothetical protein
LTSIVVEQSTAHTKEKTMSRTEEFVREQRKLIRQREQMLAYYRECKIQGKCIPYLIEIVEERYPTECCYIDISFFLRRRFLWLRKKLKRLF